jgi:tripartite-type tricarboxylate transporter receptor subunit TctC
VCSCRNGTPAPIVERLNAEINKALADPAIRENFLLAAQEPVGGSAEQFGRLFREDDIKYGRLVKELNMKLN